MAYKILDMEERRNKRKKTVEYKVQLHSFVMLDSVYIDSLHLCYKETHTCKSYSVNFVFIKQRTQICTNGCDTNTGLCVLSSLTYLLTYLLTHGAESFLRR
jgi:hypothetical protein